MAATRADHATRADYADAAASGQATGTGAGVAAPGHGWDEAKSGVGHLMLVVRGEVEILVTAALVDKLLVGLGLLAPLGPGGLESLEPVGFFLGCLAPLSLQFGLLFAVDLCLSPGVLLFLFDGFSSFGSGELPLLHRGPSLRHNRSPSSGPESSALENGSSASRRQCLAFSDSISLAFGEHSSLLLSLVDQPLAEGSGLLLRDQLCPLLGIGRLLSHHQDASSSGFSNLLSSHHNRSASRGDSSSSADEPSPSPCNCGTSPLEHLLVGSSASQH